MQLKLYGNFFILKDCTESMSASRALEDDTSLRRPDDHPRLCSGGDVLYDAHHLIPVRESSSLELAVYHLPLHPHLEGSSPAHLTLHHRASGVKILIYKGELCVYLCICLLHLD